MMTSRFQSLVEGAGALQRLEPPLQPMQLEEPSRTQQRQPILPMSPEKLKKEYLDKDPMLNAIKRSIKQMEAYAKTVDDSVDSFKTSGNEAEQLSAPFLKNTLRRLNSHIQNTKLFATEFEELDKSSFDEGLIQPGDYITRFSTDNPVSGDFGKLNERARESRRKYITFVRILNRLDPTLQKPDSVVNIIFRDGTEGLVVGTLDQIADAPVERLQTPTQQWAQVQLKSLRDSLRQKENELLQLSYNAITSAPPIDTQLTVLDTRLQNTKLTTEKEKVLTAMDAKLSNLTTSTQKFKDRHDALAGVNATPPGVYKIVGIEGPVDGVFSIPVYGGGLLELKNDTDLQVQAVLNNEKASDLQTRNDASVTDVPYLVKVKLTKQYIDAVAAVLDPFQKDFILRSALWDLDALIESVSLYGDTTTDAIAKNKSNADTFVKKWRNHIVKEKTKLNTQKQLEQDQATKKKQLEAALAAAKVCAEQVVLVYDTEERKKEFEDSAPVIAQLQTELTRATQLAGSTASDALNALLTNVRDKLLLSRTGAQNFLSDTTEIRENIKKFVQQSEKVPSEIGSTAAKEYTTLVNKKLTNLEKALDTAVKAVQEKLTACEKRLLRKETELKKELTAIQQYDINTVVEDIAKKRDQINAEKLDARDSLTTRADALKAAVREKLRNIAAGVKTYRGNVAALKSELSITDDKLKQAAQRREGRSGAETVLNSIVSAIASANTALNNNFETSAATIKRATDAQRLVVSNITGSIASLEQQIQALQAPTAELAGRFGSLLSAQEKKERAGALQKIVETLRGQLLAARKEWSETEKVIKRQQAAGERAIDNARRDRATAERVINRRENDKDKKVNELSTIVSSTQNDTNAVQVATALQRKEDIEDIKLKGSSGYNSWEGGNLLHVVQRLQDPNLSSSLSENIAAKKHQLEKELQEALAGETAVFNAKNLAFKEKLKELETVLNAAETQTKGVTLVAETAVRLSQPEPAPLTITERADREGMELPDRIQNIGAGTHVQLNPPEDYGSLLYDSITLSRKGSKPEYTLFCGLYPVATDNLLTVIELIATEMEKESPVSRTKTEEQRMAACFLYYWHIGVLSFTHNLTELGWAAYRNNTTEDTPALTRNADRVRARYTGLKVKGTRIHGEHWNNLLTRFLDALSTTAPEGAALGEAVGASVTMERWPARAFFVPTWDNVDYRNVTSKKDNLKSIHAPMENIVEPLRRGVVLRQAETYWKGSGFELLWAGKQPLQPNDLIGEITGIFMSVDKYSDFFSKNGEWGEPWDNYIYEMKRAGAPTAIVNSSLGNELRFIEEIPENRNDANCKLIWYARKACAGALLPPFRCETMLLVATKRIPTGSLLQL